MSDEELRRALQRLADTPTTRESVLAEVDRRVRRRRRFGGGLTMAAVVTAVALGAGLLTGGLPGLDDDTTNTTTAPGDWSQIAQSPLSPRSAEAAVWTGEEMLVVGGTDADPCPPNADCAGPRAAQRLDAGAAYDPTTDSWRTIPDAPQSVTYGQASWTGTEMVVLVPRLAPQTDGDVGQPAATLAFDPETDIWRELAPPPDNYLI